MDSNIRGKSLIFNRLPMFSKMAYIVSACLFLAFVVPSCKKEKDSSTLTGRSTTLGLTPSPGSNVSGNVTITENEDQSSNIKIELSNTVKDSIIYMDIHNGLFVDPFGKQADDLGTMVGTGPGAVASKTVLNIRNVTLPDLTRVSMPYDSLLTFKGFINIALVSSPHNTGTTIAHVMLGQ